MKRKVNTHKGDMRCPSVPTQDMGICHPESAPAWDVVLLGDLSFFIYKMGIKSPFLVLPNIHHKKK